MSKDFESSVGGVGAGSLGGGGVGHLCCGSIPGPPLDGVGFLVCMSCWWGVPPGGRGVACVGSVRAVVGNYSISCSFFFLAPSGPPIKKLIPGSL